MKKILIAFIFALALIIPSFSNAQFGENTGYFCADVLYPADYKACCVETKYYIANSVACDAYVKSLQQPTNPSDSYVSCSSVRFNSLKDIFSLVECFITNGIIPIIIVATVVFFLFTVFRYVSESDSKKQAEYKKAILAGIIGLFVIVSLWGIVTIVSDIAGVDGPEVLPLLKER